MCHNSFIKKEDEMWDEEQHIYDHGHDMITMNRTMKKMTSWMIIIMMAGMAVVLRGWLPHRGKVQMACNYYFPTRTMF